jgi:osmotically-inducible protein OsmY
MLRKTPVSDTSITQKVTQHLISRGIRAPCNIEVHTARGTVTVSGKVEYEHQRTAVLHIVRDVDGVANVVDRLHVMQKVSVWA